LGVYVLHGARHADAIDLFAPPKQQESIVAKPGHSHCHGLRKDDRRLYQEKYGGAENQEPAVTNAHQFSLPLFPYTFGRVIDNADWATPLRNDNRFYISSVSFFSNSLEPLAKLLSSPDFSSFPGFFQVIRRHLPNSSVCTTITGKSDRLCLF
jgi:hypothetical protein